MGLPAPLFAAHITFALIVIFGIGRVARSQDYPPALPEVVVTAERVERPVERVPMSVTAVRSGM